MFQRNEEQLCKRHYRITAPTRKISTVDLIEWLAQIAHDGKYDWGWIRRELTRRLDECPRCGTNHQPTPVLHKEGDSE